MRFAVPLILSLALVPAAGDSALAQCCCAGGSSVCACPRCACPPPWQQGASCTVTIYAAEKGIRLEHAHTWAVFSDGKEQVCISWGPARGGFWEHALRPTAGRNFTHEETLAFYRAHRVRVTALGPYPCMTVLFARAKAQKARLDSGSVPYVGLDFSHTGRCGLNCIGALLVVGRPHPTGLAHGRRAARVVLRSYRPWLVP